MVEIEPSLSGGSASRQQRYPIFKKDGAYASPAEALTQADGERIVQCINACAGITDPAAHITGLENQLEAWETSAKLRDDGLCPTQREVIADQQAQIERLEALRDELVFAAKQAHTCLDLWRDNCVQGGEHDSAWVTLMNKLAQVIAKANNTPWFPTVAKDEGGAA